MKISVLFTGGTIGSLADGSVIDVSEKTSHMLLAAYRKAFPSNKVNFIPENLFHVLSENMIFLHWKRIYDRVNAITKKDCDGIIITHGTDTLAYTATFLSFVLRHIDVPVFLVSANYPLDDKRSNGLHNFTAAVDFIAKVGTKGVFVPFWENGTTNIHLGSRLLQAQPFAHRFNSLGNVSYGRMIEEKFERNPDEHNPTPEEIEKPGGVIPNFPDEKTIMYLEPYFGIDYSVVRFTRKPSAILHGLFHSGTACTTHESEKNQLLSLQDVV